MLFVPKQCRRFVIKPMSVGVHHQARASRGRVDKAADFGLYVVISASETSVHDLIILIR